MRTFSQWGFRVRPPKEILLFLLGLFSTWQIVQFAGFALSTWLTVLAAGYLLLTHGFDFRKDWLLLCWLAATVVTFGVSMLSDIPGDYKKTSITSTLQWGLIFILCAYMRREDTDRSTSSFFRGLDWSCRIQLVWCVLQIGLYYAAKQDLNHLVFARLLGFDGQTSQYRKGVLACTGLHWHAANLIPILVYTYFRYRSVVVKLLCIVVVYFTKNATAMIAAILCLVLEFFRFAKRTLSDRNCAIRHKVAVYGMCGLFLVILFSPILFPKIWEVIEYLLLRIYQIQNPSYGNESSAVHFNYYKNLPEVLANIPVQEALFGSGVGTSGHRFSSFYGQYVGEIWTVESDFVDAVLSRGIIGMTVQYSLMCSIAWRMFRRKQTGNACFILVLMVCGFIYDNQFLWVQLTEFMLYCRSHQCCARSVTAAACSDEYTLYPCRKKE